MLKVLITDANSHMSLPFVRNLGKEKNISIITGDSYNFALSSLSKYTKEKLIYPDINKEPEKFEKFIDNNYHKFDIIIPIEDNTVDFFSKHKNKYKDKVLVSDYKNYIIARNKEKTAKLCKKLNIPHSKFLFIKDNKDINEENIKNLKFPLIIKPTRSYGMRGVNLCKDFKDLEKKSKYILQNYSYCIIEESLPLIGKNYCVDMIFDKNSNLITYYITKIHKTYPYYGGFDTITETIYNEILKEYATKIAKELKWIGIINFEFKKDPIKNKFYLIEINPRTSNSISLSINIGLNFPKVLLDLTNNKKVKPKFDYKQNIFRIQYITTFINLIKAPEKKELFKLLNTNKKNIHNDIDKKDLKPYFYYFYFPIIFIFNSSFRNYHKHFISRNKKKFNKTFKKYYKKELKTYEKLNIK